MDNLSMPCQKDLQHVESHKDHKSRKDQENRQKQQQADGPDFQVVEPHFPPTPLGLAGILAAIGADVSHIVPHADGKVALKGRHTHLVVEILTAL
jgi:hypothetical protein